MPVSSRGADVAAQVGEAARGVTSPVPLVPSSDHSPAWLPPPSTRAVPPPAPSDPGAASQLVVELALDGREAQMLRELCTAMGYDAVEMIRHALREAHAARFG